MEDMQKVNPMIENPQGGSCNPPQKEDVPGGKTQEEPGKVPGPEANPETKENLAEGNQNSEGQAAANTFTFTTPNATELLEQLLCRVIEESMSQPKEDKADIDKEEDDQNSDPDKILRRLLSGPIDVSQLHLSKPVKVPSFQELRANYSKSNLARLLIIALNQHNQDAAAINNYQKDALESRKMIQLLQVQGNVSAEQLARLRETVHGTKSERRSTMDPDCAEQKASKPTSETPPPSGNPGTEPQEEAEPQTSATKTKEPENGSAGAESGDAKTETVNVADQETDASDKDDGADKKKGYTPFRAHKSKPRRMQGCESDVTENILHACINKKLSPEELAKLENIGKKLPDGSYNIIVSVTIPVAVTVNYERVMNTRTGEVVAADSAREGKLLPGSMLTIDVLSDILFKRYSMGVSVIRIMKELEANGLKFKKQTIYRLCIQYALSLMRPLVHRMLEQILESGKAQADETWIKIREAYAREGRRNSVLWLIRVSEELKFPPVIVLCYTGSRAAAEFAKIIRGFKGKLMADGYSGYSALLGDFADTLELVGCLQHARSKFADVIQALKGKKQYSKLTPAQKKELGVNKILDQFAEVFKAERAMDPNGDWDDEKRRNHRDTVVKAELDKLYELIEKHYSELTPGETGYWAEALRYAVNQKKRYYAAVADPDMPLTNSACERCFASLGIIRGSCKQMDTVLGTEALTLWFSVLQTAKENDANEKIYLSYLLERIPGLLKEHGDYHWFDFDEMHSNEERPSYGDLKYLDVLAPHGEDYRAYEQNYLDVQRKRAIWIADLIKGETTPFAA